MYCSNIKKLEIYKDFLNYMDTQGILRNLKQTSLAYKNSIIDLTTKDKFLPPFRFLCPLDLMKVQETSERLYYLIMLEPIKELDFIKNIVLLALKIMLSGIAIEPSDIQIVPQVLNLPPTADISDLLKYPSLKLESFKGILMAKTSVIKYIRSSVQRCKFDFCFYNKPRRYAEGFDNICPKCLNIMEKDISFSDTGEEIICHFLSSKACMVSARYQNLKVRIRDELCSIWDLQIGEEFIVTGRLNENFFEAMNVQPITNEYLNIHEILSSELLVIPEFMQKLYIQISEEAPNCPWSFVLAMASFLSCKMIPVSSFLHLKFGLLLSLASQKEEEPPIPIVAVGADSLSAQYLFEAAGKLAKRYVVSSFSHSYLGGAIKPGYQSDVIWEEAGQLILAAQGVCNLGDWSKYKKEQTNYICQTIESGQIVLNKGEVGKNNLINIVPLKCAIWTYWSHITTSKNDQLQLKTLINVFGVPFLAEEKNEHEITKICWKYLTEAMNNSSSSFDEEIISLSELKEFIEIINTRQPQLTDEASQLIRSYFVVSRRDKPHCLPLAAIKTITSLAEAHAKLALRNKIICEDVIPILFLYEESMTTLYGPSLNTYSKLLWNQREPFYVFMSRQLNEFRTWLEDII